MLRGLALIRLAAITWGTTGAVTTLLVARAGVHPFVVGAARLWLGAALLLAAAAVRGPLRVPPAARLPCLAMGLCMAVFQVFLMFRLHRPDVMPVGDLGIVKAIQRCYGLRKAPSAARMLAIAEAWRPYRTVACEYLWKSLEAAPV